MSHSSNWWEEACRAHLGFFGIVLAGGLIILLKRGSQRAEQILKTRAAYIRVLEIKKPSDRTSAGGCLWIWSHACKVGPSTGDL